MAKTIGKDELKTGIPCYFIHIAFHAVDIYKIQWNFRIQVKVVTSKIMK